MSKIKLLLLEGCTRCDKMKKEVDSILGEGTTIYS